MMTKISFLMPAKNESKGLAIVLPEIKKNFPDSEIVVVDDGSTDGTSETAKSYGAIVIRHPYSKGNGASIKTGVRAISGDIVVCLDADGQHSPADAKVLISTLQEGFDMVVGQRDRKSQAGVHRLAANVFYNRFSSWMVNHTVGDLTSGFRAVRVDRFREFLSFLPNKFSYPTTITMCFFRTGYSVAYVPVQVQQRVEGTKSHVNLVKDGLRFLLIIFKVGTLFSPLKIFLPVSAMLLLGGVGYYCFTYFTDGRFTNMGALLLTSSLIVFLMGLVSEQVTTLLYKGNG